VILTAQEIRREKADLLENFAPEGEAGANQAERSPGVDVKERVAEVRVSHAGGFCGQRGSTLPPTKSTSGCASSARLICATQSGLTATSSSVNAMIAPRALAIPVFRPLETPCRGSKK
jgi:hypothetical protein